jgi:hypothetical protein
MVGGLSYLKASDWAFVRVGVPCTVVLQLKMRGLRENTKFACTMRFLVQ